MTADGGRSDGRRGRIATPANHELPQTTPSSRRDRADRPGDRRPPAPRGERWLGPRAGRRGGPSGPADGLHAVRRPPTGGSRRSGHRRDRPAASRAPGRRTLDRARTASQRDRRGEPPARCAQRARRLGPGDRPGGPADRRGRVGDQARVRGQRAHRLGDRVHGDRPAVPRRRPAAHRARGPGRAWRPGTGRHGSRASHGRSRRVRVRSWCAARTTEPPTAARGSPRGHP